MVVAVKAPMISEDQAVSHREIHRPAIASKKKMKKEVDFSSKLFSRRYCESSDPFRRFSLSCAVREGGAEWVVGWIAAAFPAS